MNDSAPEARPLLLPEQQLVDNNQIIEGWRRTLPAFVPSGNQPQFPYLLPMHMGPEGEGGGGGVTDADHDFPSGAELHKHANQRICKDTMNNGEDVPVGAERSDGESDADEEVRSLDLPPHMGVDLRSKRTLGRGQRGSVHPQPPEEDMGGQLSPQPERPMSWEGELSDHEFHPVQSASGVSHAHAHLNGAMGIKLEPLDIEVPIEEGGAKGNEPGDNEVVDMEGIQSAGPCSPQPLIHPTPHPLSNNISGHALPQGVLAYTAPTTPQTSRHEWEHSNNNKYYDNQGELRRQSCRSPVNIVPAPRLPCPPYTAEALGGPTPLPSPLLTRHPTRLPLAHHPPTPSPDSAIHSAYYSPTASPGQSRHRSSSGLSSPYSHRASPSLSRNNSDASQYSQYGGSGSQYSYSSAPSPLSPSPAQSPVQPRHMAILAAANGFPSPVMGRAGAGLHLEYPPSPLLLRHHGSYPGGVGSTSREIEIKAEAGVSSSGTRNPALGSLSNDAEESSREALLLDDKGCPTSSDLSQHSALSAQAGISRQQLINSPCPICGDKISGFHYGIFSCESCKGFFKRTVQNKKNYVCLRGAACPVTIATRKKCPACRFDKCLTTGMKLEAIREDRTRGGRSTYQCTYALPPSVLSPTDTNSSGKSGGAEASSSSSSSSNGCRNVEDWAQASHSMSGGLKEETKRPVPIPPLLLEIIGVEHLWNTQEGEGRSERRPAPVLPPNLPSNDPEYLASLCSMADHRLYKIVKWCKSLPLFKHIHIDDQISLLINTWCELLLFACCFRSIPTPGEIRVSVGKTLTLEQGRAFGIGACIERMLHLTEHLRRLKLDQYEYAAMKVIILLSSDTSNLKEPESVRASQESVLQALQQYTLTHYPEMASKFGELLLRIPELERTCQVGKEMLTLKREGDGQGFNLLMELLRGDY